ncbi:MAG: DUF1071 domain-containing protein [Rhodocyclaceae bacterium]|nr:DUF1071 domain-containing protein [Rhodocyclaceae bacterium]
MDFHKNVGTTIPKNLINSKEDLTYISWATLLGLAGRPDQSVVFFGGMPGMEIFGGVIVAVEMKVGEKLQRTWLPILDNRNQPVAGAKVTTRMLNDAISRCRAKAIAMVCGNGLSMYAGYDGDGEKFLRELALNTDSDPSSVQPIVSTKGEKRKVNYLDWAAALAAARITDPEFVWEVLHYNHTDQGTGEIEQRPYLSTAGGYMVGIKTVWRGKEHIELLPVMDHAGRPMGMPTSADWNRSVMRTLAKAIAVCTGYGLSIYAKEDFSDHSDSSETSAGQQKNQEGAQPSGQQSTGGDNAAHDALVREVTDLLSKKNRTVEQLVQWLGHPGKSIAELPDEALKRAKATLVPRAA